MYDTEHSFWSIINQEFGDVPYGDELLPRYTIIRPLPNIIIMLNEEDSYGEEPF